MVLEQLNRVCALTSARASLEHARLQLQRAAVDTPDNELSSVMVLPARILDMLAEVNDLLLGIAATASDDDARTIRGICYQPSRLHKGKT